MSEAARIAAAADLISERRLSRKRLELLGDAVRPRDLGESYAVQDAVHDRLAGSRVGRRVGYKIGCTTRVMQDYLSLPHPCAAGLFAGVIHPSGTSLPASDYCRVGIECEIAVRIDDDIPAPSVPLTGADLRPFVAAYMAAIEIVDDRYVDWRKTDAPTLIADDYFAAGAVLGPEVAAGEVKDAAELLGTTTINGTEVGRGRGHDVMGHPLNALAWLVNGLAERGKSLKKDEIVLTGSLVETKWLAAGDRVKVAVSGLGEIALTVR